MYQRITSLVLRFFRVPREPAPPHGDGASLRVFRAGRNFLRLKLAGWAIGQAAALAGITFWMAVFVAAERGVDEARDRQARTAAARIVTPPPGPVAPAPKVTASAPVTTEKAPAKKARAARPQRTMRETLAAGKILAVQALLRLPPWMFPLFWVLKIAGLLAYFAQLPVTYVIARMDYEMRWYLVTDRSLRIRHGVWKVSESTMSFANIQQVVVTQGPIQRLLGLASVKVQSAGGGGGGDGHSHHAQSNLHLGLFENVTNAAEVRDLILERLRRFRAAGLGDPDDHRDRHAVPLSASPVAAIGATPEMLAAARELLAEARALR